VKQLATSVRPRREMERRTLQVVEKRKDSDIVTNERGVVSFNQIRCDYEEGIFDWRIIVLKEV